MEILDKEMVALSEEDEAMLLSRGLNPREELDEKLYLIAEVIGSIEDYVDETGAEFGFDRGVEGYQYWRVPSKTTYSEKVTKRYPTRVEAAMALAQGLPVTDAQSTQEKDDGIYSKPHGSIEFGIDNLEERLGIFEKRTAADILSITDRLGALEDWVENNCNLKNEKNNG